MILRGGSTAKFNVTSSNPRTNCAPHVISRLLSVAAVGNSVIGTCCAPDLWNVRGPQGKRVVEGLMLVPNAEQEVSRRQRRSRRRFLSSRHGVNPVWSYVFGVVECGRRAGYGTSRSCGQSGRIRLRLVVVCYQIVFSASRG